MPTLEIHLDPAESGLLSLTLDDFVVCYDGHAPLTEGDETDETDEVGAVVVRARKLLDDLFAGWPPSAVTLADPSDLYTAMFAAQTMWDHPAEEPVIPVADSEEQALALLERLRAAAPEFAPWESWL